MALADGVRFVWLDAFIGQDGECHEFKRRFQNTLEPAAAVPPDSINVLIWALTGNAAPLLFAHTADQATKLIEDHYDKRIIFISSGSLGVKIIPSISETYSYVDAFYIFCGQISNYVEFALEYATCLQIFDHETDLLVRLARDISNDIIKLGKTNMDVNDAKNALKCFEQALILNNEANRIDTLNGQCLLYIRQLNGHGDNIGLIQQARYMLYQQERQPDEEEDDQLSQQES